MKHCKLTPALVAAPLLARKGEARPAMRSGLSIAQAQRELGWDDRGLLPVEADEGPVAMEPGIGRKRAFTLRLDPQRHARLRHACAIEGRSAQRLVTQALDEFLNTHVGTLGGTTLMPEKRGLLAVRISRD